MFGKLQFDANVFDFLPYIFIDILQNCFTNGISLSIHLHTYVFLHIQARSDVVRGKRD